MLFLFVLSYTVTLLLSSTIAGNSGECVIDPESASSICTEYCNALDCVIGNCSGDTCECMQCLNLLVNNYENKDMRLAEPVEIDDKENDSRTITIPTTNVRYENDNSDEVNVDNSTVRTVPTITASTATKKWFRIDSTSVVYFLLVTCILLAIALTITCILIYTHIYKKPIQMVISRQAKAKDQFDIDGIPLNYYHPVQLNEV